MKTDIILRVLGGLILFGFGYMFTETFLEACAKNLVGYWVMLVPAILYILAGWVWIQAVILYFKEPKESEKKQ